MTSARSYAGTEAHKISTSTARAFTEPVPSGFMRSVMRHHDVDDVDDEGLIMPTPQKKITQEEQDEIDEKARKRATKNLVNSWQERLQLISVITTFFASTEAAMLVNTKPANSADFENNILKASNACLLGALIAHVYAAILSFLGAFLLIRYKLKEATREELRAEGLLVNSPVPGSVFKDVERAPPHVGLQHNFTNSDSQSTMHKSTNHVTTTSVPGRAKRKSSFLVEPPIISTNPHLEQVGLFRRSVSSHLLSRTHTVCVFLASAGFILAIVGILCYAWASQPRAVSIFASTCFGGAVLAMVVLLI